MFGIVTTCYAWIHICHGRGEGTKIEMAQTAVDIVIYTPDAVVVAVVGICSHPNIGIVVSFPFLSPVVLGGDGYASKLV